MKIVHLYGKIARMHGATKWVMAFASEIKNRGIESDILCTEFNIPKPYWLTANIKTSRIKKNRSDKQAKGKLYSAIRNYIQTIFLIFHIPCDANIIVFHSENTVPLILLAKFRCPKAKLIYYCYQPPREVYDLWHVTKQDFSLMTRVILEFSLPFYRFLDKKLVQQAHTVLIWSNQYQDYAQKIYGNMNYTIVPAGVDFRTFNLLDTQILKKRSDIRKGYDYLLLMNASLTRKKNIDLFITLINDLTQEGLNVIGVVIGEGPLRTILESMAKRLEVTNHFVLAGYVSQEELPYFYHSADILFYLEPNGAWTMSVIEAGAAKKAVIVASGGSMPTLVDDGNTGYILNNLYDAEEIKIKTMKLLKNNSLRIRMGERNFSHCKKFSLKHSANVFLNECQNIH